MFKNILNYNVLNLFILNYIIFNINCLLLFLELII